MNAIKTDGLVFFLAFALTILTAGAGQGNILPTKHNLSANGPGTVRASSENRVCIFCHTPHHASADIPLWSRETSGATYNLYGSSTLLAQPGQPTGSARLCLSCHDGTISLGMLHGAQEPIALTGGISNLPAGRSNLATDLSDDHPISFAYTSTLAAQRGELKDPQALPPEVKLEEGEMLQCTSCHNPHKDPHGMFLVMSNTASALCLACHDKAGWTLSSHAGDAALVDQGCANCHSSHGAPGAKHLLQSALEEGTCLTDCHNGIGAGVDIQAASDKFYSHPFAFGTGIHDATEDPLSMERHVECADCHNPHRVGDQGAPLAAPPSVNARMEGIKGVTATGAVIGEAVNEYEICFRCHADNPAAGASPVPRMIQESNIRLRFDTANPSFHPVVAPGKNIDVPSLRPEYSESSMIYCTDCHGSDSSLKVGGSGADGPHGSIYPHILIARYEQDAYPLNYNVTNYDLCFRCHDPDVLFDTALSAFGKDHKFHVRKEGTPCSACHDPHGVPVLRGASSTGNAHLINFDTRFVDPATASYDSVARSCTVSCHQVNPAFY